MITVTKRNGEREPLDIEKFHKVITWACSGLTGVSVSQVALKSHVQFYDKIKTSDVQETLIKAAADLITEEEPNYQYVAGRLLSYHVRKDAYGDYNPPHLYDQYTRVMKLGFYDKYLYDMYSTEDFNILNDYIVHERDNSLTYAAMETFRTKYLVKNRVTGKIFETPQFSFMFIAMTMFAKYKENRLKYVKDYYDAISQFDISLPTPIMAGLRTPQRQFSSCVLVETDDSLDSINATASAIVKYVSQKAGIGIGIGRIRALGSTIRNGDAYHTGIIPYIKYFQSAVSVANQGGVRKGSATANIPIYHLEIEDILVLKNSKGSEESRARNLDYCIQFNKVFYERLISGGNITLFSPSETKELYDYFFTDVDKFRELYEQYERKTSVRKKVVKAIDLFSAFVDERKDTGRIYLSNVDNINKQGSFIAEKATTRMTNLCVEITLPTKPLNNVMDGTPEKKLLRMTKENYEKYLTWRKNNPNTPINRRKEKHK